VKSYTLGNGQVYSRTIDQDGRIASYTLGATNYAISFDAASRITAIGANTYGYDVLDRLTSTVLPSSNFGYGYDAVGNRLTKITGAATNTYTYSSSSNRIASLTPASGPARSFVFDANGSTTDDGLNTYAYDTRGRMVQATSSVGATAYQVNALGQRIRKTNPTDDRIFHYDTRGRLIAETDPAGRSGASSSIWATFPSRCSSERDHEEASTSSSPPHRRVRRECAGRHGFALEPLLEPGGERELERIAAPSATDWIGSTSQAVPTTPSSLTSIPTAAPRGRRASRCRARPPRARMN